MALFSSDRPDRRSEPRRPANTAGLIVAPQLEATCTIVDLSETGMRVRLHRQTALPEAVVVIDLGKGVAHEARVVRRQGLEAGLKRQGQVALGGLVPARLATARQAWLRASGR
ncbi:MAG: PilZ domain-containing protein [Brevundimonas sp.]|uniref:PilZ domain-containing protein n=1 Tax=Brevundimonas sp. TaxID=1871086 RepID=UPI0025BF61DB|nr:PilZ domain-containing protein [Brevundimonas sp.]MBX3477513.1 PilZ domain-containing protein [Brevundimonas sp.]